MGTHGVLPEEKTRAQPFEIDLDLFVDLTLAAVSDRLADTVDYAEVATTAAAIVGSDVVRVARGHGCGHRRGHVDRRPPDHRRHRAPPQAPSTAARGHRHVGVRISRRQ